MKLRLLLFFLLAAFSLSAHAQNWAGILSPTTGANACTAGDLTSPGKCAIDWSTAGVLGGIPNRTTICATINSSSFGAGSQDATSAINSALATCPAGQVVSLSAGTFLINGNISVPSNVTLRGQGADQTILNAMGTSGYVVQMGSGGGLSISSATSIVAGASAGSTSITLGTTPPSGFAVGNIIAINELNPKYVSIDGSEGACTYCDVYWSGTRTIGQIVQITQVNGSTLTISPGLYIDYSAGAPLAVPVSSPQIVMAGVENLQVYANNTGYTANFSMENTVNCWLSGVEGNYTDGDQVDIGYSYHDEVVNSYFSNAFNHTSGGTDSDIDVRTYSSGILIQNNILERLHASTMLEEGSSGNVVSYNYDFGGFNSTAYLWMGGGMNMHGAHPMLNLFEGNESGSINLDSIHGSSSDNTMFRNWFGGAIKNCMPSTGRGTVTCSPFGQPANAPPNTGGINGWWESESVMPVNLTFLANSNNSIGNIVGSTTMSTIYKYDSVSSGLLPQVYIATAICGLPPCGAGSRSLVDHAFDYAIGYGEASDDGTGGTSAGAGCDGSLSWTCHSITPYNSLFIDGDFNSVNKSINWPGGTPQTLPPSFYLSGEPSWWGNVPWPAIGPDVSGGLSTAFGHAYAIPAMNCYQNVMGGTDGTGSPLSFNSAKCYPDPNTSALAPPTNLTAIIQ